MLISTSISSANHFQSIPLFRFQWLTNKVIKRHYIIRSISAVHKKPQKVLSLQCQTQDFSYCGDNNVDNKPNNSLGQTEQCDIGNPQGGYITNDPNKGQRCTTTCQIDYTHPQCNDDIEKVTIDKEYCTCNNAIRETIKQRRMWPRYRMRKKSPIQRIPTMVNYAPKDCHIDYGEVEIECQLELDENITTEQTSYITCIGSKKRRTKNITFSQWQDHKHNTNSSNRVATQNMTSIQTNKKMSKHHTMYRRMTWNQQQSMWKKLSTSYQLQYVQMLTKMKEKLVTNESEEIS